MIRHATLEDASEICEIYNHYVLNTSCTQEDDAVSVDEMKGRIQNAQESFNWIVYVKDGKILGYAYAGTFKPRCGYRYTVESSVYVREGKHRSNVGSHLYKELFTLLKGLNIRAVIAILTLPNDASVAFHEKHNFCKAAHFHSIAIKFGTWHDIGYWQLDL